MVDSNLMFNNYSRMFSINLCCRLDKILLLLLVMLCLTLLQDWLLLLAIMVSTTAVHFLRTFLSEPFCFTPNVVNT